MNAATFPKVAFAEWRALVEKELAGKPFDKALVHEPIQGVPIAPLYVQAPSVDASVRASRGGPFQICMRHDSPVCVSDLLVEVADGADALWFATDLMKTDDVHQLQAVLGHAELARTTFVFEPVTIPSGESVVRLVNLASPSSTIVVAADPLAWCARGHLPFASVPDQLVALGRLAAFVRESERLAASVVVSTEPYHDAGADAVDELAIGLGAGAVYLEALLGAGLTPDEASSVIALRSTVGRDTFLELCKLRALRICWSKLLVASGASPMTRRPLLHAVCSSQTLTLRDPWVNMLRVTTQVFAAVMGGADLVTPNEFDRAFGVTSNLGHRVARNTGLVLREESGLGKVADPAGGSYYFDTLTDALARQAWARFREFARSGGVLKMIGNGDLAHRLEASWKKRLERIATRKEPILGVSEFANLGETLPHPAPAIPAISAPIATLAVHRDAAVFEELRARAESLASPPEVLLRTLGTFAESRARVGFAANFFSAGGIRTRETSDDEPAKVVCLCGTDDAYAEQAVACAVALKNAGAEFVLLAGRPNARENELRGAGVDGFIFMGCDAVSALGAVVARFGAASHEEVVR